MEMYIDKWAAIVGLHESGFTEDFVFSGNNILWVQQKVLLLPQDITLIDFYRFGSGSSDEILIFAVIAKYSSAKGILITHRNTSKNKTIPVIASSLLKPHSAQLAYS
jgi:hypothetical protein